MRLRNVLTTTFTALTLLAGGAAVVAPAAANASVAAHHSVRPRLAADDYFLDEYTGTYNVGATSLAAGNPVTERLLAVQLHFDNSTTYMGVSAGLLKNTSGNYMATTTTCGGVTWKSSSTADGTVWAFESLGGGVYHIVNRYCDQKQAAGAFQVVLSGNNVSGNQFGVCDENNTCPGHYIRFAVPQA